MLYRRSLWRYSGGGGPSEGTITEWILVEWEALRLMVIFNSSDALNEFFWEVVDTVD